METLCLATNKKNAYDWRATLVFLDESGVCLTPPVRRTWAPRGETPQVQTTLRGGKLNLIGALSVSPRYQRLSVHAHLHTRTMDGRVVIAFLKNLLHDIRGCIVLLWDNSPIHKDQKVQKFVARHPRLHCYSFPAYAPELNPAEGIWNQIDQPLGNHVCDDVTELTQLVAKTFRQLRKKQDLLWSCIGASELPWKR